MLRPVRPYRERTKEVPYFKITPTLTLNLYQVLQTNKQHMAQTRADYSGLVGHAADEAWNLLLKAKGAVKRANLFRVASVTAERLKQVHADAAAGNHAAYAGPYAFAPAVQLPESATIASDHEHVSVSSSSVLAEGEDAELLVRATVNERSSPTAHDDDDPLATDVDLPWQEEDDASDGRESPTGSVFDSSADDDDDCYPGSVVGGEERDGGGAFVMDSLDDTSRQGTAPPLERGAFFKPSAVLRERFKPLAKGRTTVGPDVSVDVPVTQCRRLKFTELWRDFVIQNCIPRLAAERFMLDLVRENPEFDIHDMPLTWKTLAKLPKGENHVVRNALIDNREEDPLHKLSGAHEKFRKLCTGPPVIVQYKETARTRPVVRYVDFGVFKRINRVLKDVLKATFPNGDAPECPHLLLELWTDGLSPYQTGVENNVWPNCISIIGVADSPRSNQFRCVPAFARKPLTIGILVSGKKPFHPNLLLKTIVRELILLDPHPRGDRDQELAFEMQKYFTVRLGRLLADTLARALAKNIPSHCSKFFCEVCVSEGFALRPNKLDKQEDPRAKGTGVIIYLCKERNMELREDSKFLEYPDHGGRVRIISTC